MIRANLDIRIDAKDASVPFWRICDEMKISEPTFTRLMRKELPDAEKEKIRAIIRELSAEEATQ